MGQSRGKTDDSEPLEYSVFQTPLGWWGIVGKAGILVRSYCGYQSQGRLVDALREEIRRLVIEELRAMVKS